MSPSTPDDAAAVIGLLQGHERERPSRACGHLRGAALRRSLLAIAGLAACALLMRAASHASGTLRRHEATSLGSVLVADAAGSKVPTGILAKVRVVPYGVLGTQLTSSGQIRRRVSEPDAQTAFVDPAGLLFIRSGPRGAGGASGAIYKFLGISGAPAFPKDVRAAITEPTQAKFHAYGEKLVIHVVGPNFQGRTDCSNDDALGELSQAYASTLEEFASCPARRLRLLPISSSIFAGPFLKDMPELTAKALQQGFEMLSPQQQDKVLHAESLEMCIFSEAELGNFEAAFRAG